MTAAIAPAPSLAATGGRAIVAFTRKLAGRVASAASTGGATVLGAAGLASVAVGAGMVYLPAGFIVGGVLAVWFASLLAPGGGDDA